MLASANGQGGDGRVGAVAGGARLRGVHPGREGPVGDGDRAAGPAASGHGLAAGRGASVARAARQGAGPPGPGRRADVGTRAPRLAHAGPARGEHAVHGGRPRGARPPRAAWHPRRRRGAVRGTAVRAGRCDQLHTGRGAAAAARVVVRAGAAGVRRPGAAGTDTLRPAARAHAGHAHHRGRAALRPGRGTPAGLRVPARPRAPRRARRGGAHSRCAERRGGRPGRDHAGRNPGQRGSRSPRGGRAGNQPDAGQPACGGVSRLSGTVCRGRQHWPSQDSSSAAGTTARSGASKPPGRGSGSSWRAGN